MRVARNPWPSCCWKLPGPATQCQCNGRGLSFHENQWRVTANKLFQHRWWVMMADFFHNDQWFIAFLVNDGTWWLMLVNRGSSWLMTMVIQILETSTRSNKNIIVPTISIVHKSRAQTSRFCGFRLPPRMPSFKCKFLTLGLFGKALLMQNMSSQHLPAFLNKNHGKETKHEILCSISTYQHRPQHTPNKKMRSTVLNGGLSCFTNLIV